MIRKNNKDALDIFKNFKKVLEDKPSLEKMFEEVRMMRFKIKPISGDIFLMQLKGNNLIEVLWQLGKLDELFQREYRYLAKDQKEVFFRLFDSLYYQFQNQLNSLNSSEKEKPNLQQALELEIFKDFTPKKKAN